MRIWIAIILFFLQAQLVRDHFADVQKGALKRWDAFKEGREFIPYTPGRKTRDLIQEFKKLDACRREHWLLPDYAVAEQLIKNGHVRFKSGAAFRYNNTASYYNASTVFIGNTPYIALQGPRTKEVKRFFTLLKSLKVTRLVRLTDAYEGKKEKCSPYWKGILDEDHLHIPHKGKNYRIRAFDIAEWPDNSGIDPKRLLEQVLEVKKIKGLLAVHCSAGVGRTGTFLAALAIVEAIDNKQPLSIEEIVYRLSLQRRASVSTDTQYITLYRLAELYKK